MEYNKTITILIGMALLAFVVALCVSETKNPEYVNVTLLHKKEALGSHYNAFTKKQVMETNYYFIYSDGSLEKVNITKYVTYEEGSKFRKLKGVTDYE